MNTLGSFPFILIIVFLITLLFDHIFSESSLEFTVLMTFFTGLLFGSLLYLMNVEILSSDLVFFSASLPIAYGFFSLKKMREEKNKPKEIIRMEKIIDKIVRKKKKVFKRIEKRGGLEDYLYLKMEYEKGNAVNPDFQEKFKDFYNMRLFGFTEDFYKTYFGFLSSKDADLKKILTDLSKIEDESGKKTVQLAFASKLIHMIDGDLPLYNSTVASELNLKISRGPIEKRIKSSLETYELLKTYYRAFQRREKLKNMMNEFREEHNYAEGVLPNTKLIDLFIKGVNKIK